MPEPITPAKLAEWKAAGEALPVERTYKADLKFANIARTAMPRLIERVEALATEVKRLQSERDGPRGYVETVASLRGDLAKLCAQAVEAMESRRAPIIRLENDLMDMSKTIVELRTENERLREVLAPFAEVTQYMAVGKGWAPKEIGIWTDNASGCRLTVATFQAAAAALEPEGGDS